MLGISNTKDALIDHFTRAWEMATEAVGCFPEGEWWKESDGAPAPARITYALLAGAERYTWMRKAKDFQAQHAYRLDWEKAGLRDLPLKKEALERILAMEAVTIGWIEELGELGLTKRKAIWPWTGTCMLGQALFLLRYVQHYVARLNGELRRRGLTRAEWR